jgi:predicted AlkP superfamily phosphohydrolase/phosphomutase
MTVLARHSRTPVIAIALEAGEPALIERWCAQGHLPVLRSLRDRGAWRRLRSNTDISSGSTWASVNTGTGPGKHGMAFYHRQLRSGTYRLRKRYAHEIGREPFWEALGRAGKRVAVVDVPVSFVTPGFNGLQLVGWGEEGLNAPQSSWPSSLLRRIRARHGRHPLDGWFQRRPESLDEWRALSSRVLLGAQRRAAIIRELHAEEPWDLFLAAFAEPHWIGHYFWHIIDAQHPDHDPRVAAACTEGIRQTWHVIDQAIGDLLAAAPGATLLIFSNTGMGPNYSGQHLLPEILGRLGLAGRHAPSLQPHGLSRLLPGRYVGAHAIREISRVISPQNIERAKRVIPERLWDDWTRWLLALGNTWKESRAFAVPTDASGAIRINLKGREPEGRVDPGAAYDRLCDELAQTLRELVNPATGGAAVSEVIKVADHHVGEQLDELPDVIVKWTGDAPIEALTSSRVGTVSGRLPDLRTGSHATYGFLLAVAEGQITRGVLPDADIMDLAPTIMWLMGEPVPPDLDGGPLTDLVGDSAPQATEGPQTP